MVIGVGVDIVSPEKFKEAVSRWGQEFLERIFNPEELAPLSQGKLYYQRLAARFAAKEAVIKALGKKYPLGLKDIVIVNLPSGAPICKLKKNIDNLKVLISIAHIQNYAIAIANAQKTNIS